MMEIDEARMAKCLDIWAMVEAQANETIELGETDDGSEFVIIDQIAGRILYSIAAPRKDYPRARAWSEAQAKLHELRKRRVVLAIVAAANGAA